MFAVAYCLRVWLLAAISELMKVIRQGPLAAITERESDVPRAMYLCP